MKALLTESMGYRAFISTVLAAFALASPVSFAADAAHGQQLLNTYCVVCHGFPPQGGPELAADNPGLIRFALNNIPAMFFLRSTISDADAADIAAYVKSLSSPPPPPPPVTPAFDYTDLWWNPLQGGWGFNLIQHPLTTNNIFGVMYIYDEAGHPIWFILPGGTWETPTRFTGPWATVSGSTAAQAYHFNPPTVVGSATINFIDRNHATLTFTVNGVTTQKTMEVLAF